LFQLPLHRKILGKLFTHVALLSSSIIHYQIKAAAEMYSIWERVTAGLALHWTAGMLILILVKTIVNTNNDGALWHIDSLRLRNILTYLLTYLMILLWRLFTVYYIQQRSFFPRSSINKLNRMIVVEKWQNQYSLQWHDVMRFDSAIHLFDWHKAH